MNKGFKIGDKVECEKGIGIIVKIQYNEAIIDPYGRYPMSEIKFIS